MPRKKVYESNAARVAAFQKEKKDRLNYQVDKRADYNKAALQAAADRLANGSITTLINAAIADYLPRVLGDDLDAVKAAGKAAAEEAKQDK